MEKTSPHTDDLTTRRGIALSVFNYIYDLPSQQAASPNGPSLLPVVYGLHSDVPPTEGEEQALYPPLSLQHQVLVRCHSHFLPESCNLENRTRNIPGSAQPSQTGSPAPVL